VTATDPTTGVLVTSVCRRLRLSPLAAAVLQDLLLDAHQGPDGNIMVATSARVIAERLEVPPKQIATALAQLRRQDLLGLLPPRGRFGLSDYWVTPGPGRRIVRLADLDDHALSSARAARTNRAPSRPGGQPQLDLWGEGS
jgi:hypothetical protein